jgi:Effector-associated domain 11/CHAT domain
MTHFNILKISMENIKNLITNLVANAKLDQALDEFIKWASVNDKDLNNQLILTKGRLSSLKRQENLGLLGFSDASRDRAQIANAILEMTNLIGMSTPMADTKSSPSIPKQPTTTVTSSTGTGSGNNKKILFLASNPSNTGKLQLDKEFRQVFQSVQEGSLGYEMVVEWAVTPNDLQRVVLKHKPGIIHFAGHGEKTKTEKQAATGSLVKTVTIPAGIVLQDANGQAKLVAGIALANLFKICLRKFSIDLVVLSACHSEEQAKAIAEAGIKYVAGMNTAVEDETAIEFSTGLYRGIASEGDIEFAFDLATNNIMLQGLAGDNIPVLHKKPV